MSGTIEPLKTVLMKDNDFTMTVSKIVNSRIRHDRFNVLNGIADSELEVSRAAVPKISGDLTKDLLTTLDSVLTRKYGEKWFKDRRTHPSNIPSNLDLQCSIIVVFYEGNVDMISLVESELSKADDRASGINADEDVMYQFFASSEGVRAGAWAEIEARYTLSRERLQRKSRSQRHRDKKKEDKMFGSDESEGGDKADDLDEPNETYELSETGRNKPGSSKRGLKCVELRVDSTIPPLKSVALCVKQFLDVMKFVSDPKKRTDDKISRLEGLFESLAADLDMRIGVRVLHQDSEFCFMIGALNVILEMVPDVQHLSERLARLTKDLSAQGSVVVDPLMLHKTRRVQIEKLLSDQRQLMAQFVKRWMEDDGSALVISSGQLDATARSVAELGDLIVRELDEVPNTLTARDVLWVLGQMSVWYVRSCVLSTSCYKSGSSFKRMGDRVSLVAGER